jgi:hypothetical protein
VSGPLFPVRHESLSAGGRDDPAPWDRFVGRHEGVHYCDVARTPPKPGQPVIRSCQCGSLFMWHDPGWKYMDGWARWRHRRLLMGAMGLFDGGPEREWRRGPRHWLRRAGLRLRGWDA